MPKILNLRELADPTAGQIRLSDDTVHRVQRISGLAYHDLLASDDPTARSRLTVEIAREVVPTLSDAQFRALDLAQTYAVVTLAAGGIEALEELFPNAVAEATASTPSASAPATPSDVSSSP